VGARIGALSTSSSTSERAFKTERGELNRALVVASHEEQEALPIRQEERKTKSAGLSLLLIRARGHGDGAAFGGNAPAPSSRMSTGLVSGLRVNRSLSAENHTPLSLGALYKQ